MKILVTGGAGFIGSHLVDALIAKGHQVMVIDDFSAGSRKFVNSNAKTAAVDIRAARPVEKAFASFKPRVVFHLAAASDIRVSREKPLEDYAVNMAGAMIVLEAARKHKVERFIFASSAAVYGDNQNLPLRENEPVGPIYPYGAAKAGFEHYLEAYSRQFGLKAVSLRFSNVYGPRQGTVGEGGVVAIFYKRLLAGKPLVIFGDGKQTRDFIFVDDAARANLAALTCQKSYAAYNVSTQKATAVNELARRLLVVARRKIAVKHAAPVKGEVKHSVLSNALIKKEFGWSPRATVSEGLKKTWEWFNANM